MPRLMIIAAIATLSAPSLAQDLPSPALEGDGQSTQSLELAKETLTVTIDAGGGFSTQGGEASGNLSLDVNGLGVSLGTLADQNPADADTATGQPQASGAVGASAGTSGDAVAAAASGGLDSCASADRGLPLSVADIAQVGAGARVMLIEGCPEGTITTQQRQAVADNAALSMVISERGLAPDDLNAITILRDVITLNYRVRR